MVNNQPGDLQLPQHVLDDLVERIKQQAGDAGLRDFRAIGTVVKRNAAASCTGGRRAHQRLLIAGSQARRAVNETVTATRIEDPDKVSSRLWCTACVAVLPVVRCRSLQHATVFPFMPSCRVLRR